MAPLLNKIEQVLEPIFKSLPPLPKGAKDWLAKAWPILAVVFGVLQLVAAWSLWHAGRSVNELVDITNDWARAYGVHSNVAHLSVFYWLALIFLVVDAVILLAAFPALQARRKSGWDLLFLGAILNLVYGVFSVLDADFGGAGKLVSALIGSAIGFYVLFQMRDVYSGKTPVANVAAKNEQPKN
ncbi:MAG TPA: hypothetical protein VIR03_02545 [Candidatus Saccharimonadales bacterium]